MVERLGGEELALLGVVVLLVVLPGLQCLERADAPRHETFPVEPLRVDVDTAEWYDWTLFSGIGEARARRIVAYRERHGPLRTADDLRRIPGLPKGWVDEALPYLRFGPSRGDGAPVEIPAREEAPRPDAPYNP